SLQHRKRCGSAGCLRAPAGLPGEAETGTNDGHPNDRRQVKTFGQRFGQWEVLDRFRGAERCPFVNALNELYARYSLDELQFVGNIIAECVIFSRTKLRN